MGILTRFKDIMSSNINALLDKAEDPEKMIDQCLRNLNKDLRDVKSETAAVMAEYSRTQRELAEVNEKVEKLQNYAMKAIGAGNDEDARKFLEKKTLIASEQAAKQQACDLAKINADNMRAMHDKLQKDISELESRRATLKAKMSSAKAQKRINEMASSSKGGNSSLAAFDRLEDRVNNEIDKANAMAELNAVPKDEVDDLMGKYDSAPSSNVDDELAALKAMMGK
ncbi:MAG: PspA/IM30 family protein [Bacillota bacterium]